MNPPRRPPGAGRSARQRGVSLVEAMVSLAAMGIGMLGLVGLQSTMRFNADIAKQRSEAVRLAQEQVEQWRSYSTLSGFRDDVVSFSGAAVAFSSTNTAYAIDASVGPPPAPPVVPPLKDVSVVVSWADRASNPQSVRLVTRIAAAQPAISAALATPSQGNPVRLPQGRHPAIPPGAIQLSTLTSGFVPPNAGDVGWVFNNVTGLISSVCNAAFTECAVTNRLLLSGFVRFDLLSSTAPTAESARYPTGGRFALRVRVNTTLPTTATVDCFVGNAPADALAYYCAMPLTSSLPFRWSGTPEILEAGGGSLPLPADATDARADRLRVCRYAPLGAPAVYPYVNVAVPRSQQNYLLVRAGDGTNVWSCPSDSSVPAALNVNTVPHQPAP